MPLFSTATLAWTVVGLASATIAAFGAFDRRRARRRNQQARCARCGCEWSARYPEVERAHVAGAEVCAPCAATLRTRLRFGLIGVLGACGLVGGATLVSNGYDIAIGNRDFAWGPLLYWVPTSAVLLGIAGFGLAQLKRWNRAASAPSLQLTQPLEGWGETVTPTAHPPEASTTHRAGPAHR